MNKIMLTGRTTAHPELQKTPTDKSVLKATLAVSRRFKNHSGERETDFINLVIWGKQAEHFASHVKKGSLLLIEGELRTRTYTDKQDQRRYMTEVLVQQFEFLESRATVALRENNFASPELAVDAEDLPF